MKVILLSKLKSRLDLSQELLSKLNDRRNKLKKQVGLFDFD